MDKRIEDKIDSIASEHPCKLIPVCKLHELAEYITSLSPWKSIKDELPDVHSAYLTCSMAFNGRPIMCEVITYNPATDEWGGSIGVGLKPTHWMPIPKIK